MFADVGADNERGTLREGEYSKRIGDCDKVSHDIEKKSSNI